MNNPTGKVIITRRIKVPPSFLLNLVQEILRSFIPLLLPPFLLLSREIEFVLPCLHIASLDYFYEFWRDVIENGRICQDNGSVDGHPFGILDGGRKNQKLAAEVVQSGRKLVSIRMLSILEISDSISHIFFPNIRSLEIIQRNCYCASRISWKKKYIYI